jgi:hypothetical protein
VLHLDIPVGLGLEQGRSKLQLARLNASATHEHQLRICPPKPGRFVIGIPNLSYRDGFGRSCRVRDRSVELMVEPPLAGPTGARSVAGAAPAGARALHLPTVGRRTPSVFVSYRRSDADLVAGPLAATLGHYLRGMRVFLDVSTLRPGEDWSLRIEKELCECAALVAIIGPTWLSLADGPIRRIDAPQDVVRREIATALKRGVPVIPVLIRTSMPRSEDLPGDIRDLSKSHALKYDPDRYRECLVHLALVIRSRLEEQPKG